jgi:NAD-dependent SIR2 family protein deacetylase
MEILTMQTFRKDPGVVWKWHYDFIELMKNCSINEGHKAIFEFQKLAKTSKKFDCLLVT